MNRTIHWGILGTGWIANTFAQGLAQLADAELVAVGSRTLESAERFAEQYGVPHRHASYQALANDADELESVFKRADAALYDAKSGGRNRMCCDHDETSDAVLQEAVTKVS